MKILEVGKLNRSQDGVVISPNGISKTLTAGHNNQLKIIVASRGRNSDNPSNKTQGNRYKQILEAKSDGISNTITTIQKDNYLLELGVEPKIRKITPKETWRLMSFADEDFQAAEAVTTKSHLYEQAGKSICRNVMIAIMSQLNIDSAPTWDEIKGQF